MLLTAELQAFSVASWFCFISFLQLSLYPSLKKTFDTYAFPVSFAGSLLLFTLVSWYCGFFRLPVQLALAPFVVLSIYHLYKRHYTIEDFKGQLRWELVFCIFFFLMLEVRFLNPTISYAEKFMDHAFLASVMRQPVVPPLDPWFSGGFLNVYYYLGYWMFGCFGIVTGVPSNIAFNLALPTVLGISAVTLYATGDLLLDRFKWLPVIILLIPNPALIIQSITGTAVNPEYSSWLYWLGTRTITNTINEYPLFSFIWGDVHPHVIGMFNQVFLIFILVYAWKRWAFLKRAEKLVLCGLGAISLGAMPLINTWDVLIYGPIVVISGILILLKNKTDNLRTDGILLLILFPVASIICYLPFYFRLEAHTKSFGIVQSSLASDPVQFLFVHGFFILIFILSIVHDIPRRPYLLVVPLLFILAGYNAAAIAALPLVYLVLRRDPDVPELLAIFGLLIIILCELVFVRDYMGDINFRMNTVFKWYIAAWFFMGISAVLMAGRYLSKANFIPDLSKRENCVFFTIILCVLFIAPWVIHFNPYYEGYTLDGLAYLNTSHPGDAAAVAYLRSLQSNEIIVEAEGSPYSYFSRISSFTGIPTVIGWTNHEGGWRSLDQGDSRSTDVKAIYEQSSQTLPLMKKYNVTLLVIGETERNRYSVTLPSQGLDLIFAQDGTDIYRVIG